MRTAIYLKPLGEEPLAIDQQLAAMRAFARAKWGRGVVRIYKEDLPGRLQMLIDAEAHKFDVLLFWSLQHLSQSGIGKTVELLHQLAVVGVQYRSFTEPHFDSCQNKALEMCIATLFAQRKAAISNGTKAGLKRRKASGRAGVNGFIGPGRPHVQFNIKEAQVLRDEQLSYEKIAQRLGVSKATLFRALKRKERVA